MSHQNYYEYKGEIDLDEQTLFDYVNQQNEIKKSIENAVPEKPEIFGKASEPFQSTSSCKNNQNKVNPNLKNTENEEDDEKEENTYKKNEGVGYFKWIVFILLGILALYFLFSSQLICETNVLQSNKMNRFPKLDQNTFDTQTPTVGSEFRAMFVR